MVGFEHRITLKNVGDPDPPRWQLLLLGTHPSTMERIGQALADEDHMTFVTTGAALRAYGRPMIWRGTQPSNRSRRLVDDDDPAVG